MNPVHEWQMEGISMEHSQDGKKEKWKGPQGFAVCLLTGVGQNIVVAKFWGGLVRWWTSAALCLLVEPSGKGPRNWASKDICKKLSHRSQSHCGETWAPPFLRQNCVKPHPFLKSCTSFITMVNQPFKKKKCYKIFNKQSKILSLKKKSIEIEIARLMEVLLRETLIKQVVLVKRIQGQRWRRKKLSET